MDAKKLGTIPLFAGLPKKEREQVARWADQIDVAAGHALLTQGRFAHEFFLILDGTVEVTKDGAHLADLGPGDFFGEIALVEHERRSATVVTTSPVTAMVMHSRDFDEMRSHLPHVAEKVHDAIRERLAR
ncbi:MAG TPA: cyclic nucleotide-binding domain-containing protein [Actinomycetota bacterium]|jgi:CRP-like cAMP-binding protein|nr:cyclic nucleotide-binding domain-containing protein [Actinomycetota bacterium]